MTSRLRGLAAPMPAPTGTPPPEGTPTDTDTQRQLPTNPGTGGTPHPGTPQRLEQCTTDPHAAHLMAAMLRGDPTTTPAPHTPAPRS